MMPKIIQLYAVKVYFCPFKHENVKFVTAVVSVTKAKKDTKNLFLKINNKLVNNEVFGCPL